MTEIFTSQFFSANREKLRAVCPEPLPIIVTANGLLQRGGDSTYPFEQDAGFWYLTGINDPDVILVLDGDTEYLIVPGRGDSRVAFDGAVAWEDLSRISGIAKVVDEASGWKQLSSRLKRGKRVATLGAAPSYIDSHGLYTNPARSALGSKLKELTDNLEVVDVAPQLARLRSLKQPAELVALQSAIDITIATLEAVCQPDRLAAYRYEYEIEADIFQGFRRRGADGHAFDPIVAGGQRACTLHNVANNASLGQQELLVLDVGAAVSHYAADITRTVAPATPTKRQQAVYDAVLDVQEYAKSLLRPGVFMKEYEQQVETYMGTTLQALGLIKTSEHEAIRHYFPHATSHFLGLNVHDAGDYSQPLAAGMVITVEPGIYINEEAIGIRIEDDVLLTDEGIQVLSAGLPRRLR